MEGGGGTHSPAATLKALSPRRLRHGWHCTELLQHAELVVVCPTFDLLPVAEMSDHGPGDRDALSSWSDAHEGALVSARSRNPSGDLVSFQDQIVDLEFGIREGLPVHGHELLDTVEPPNLTSRRRRIVRYAVWSHELLDEVELALVPDLIDKLPRELFEISHG